MISYYNITFAYPWVLLLLIVIPMLIVEYIKTHKRASANMMATTIHFVSQVKSIRVVFYHSLFVLKCTALVLLIFALARPQQKFVKQQISGDGIDIMLCFDVSGSMTQKDIEPSRIEASKIVATEFVSQRPADRIGVVVFSDQGFTLCPLTLDHKVVLSQILHVEGGYLQNAAGTALGTGIATCVDRLRNSESASKVILLLTDGADFGDEVSQQTSVRLANLYGIKVYAIGMGSSLPSVSVQKSTGKVGLNIELLKNLSIQTGGQYFHASDKDALQKVFAGIDQMEKSSASILSYDRFTDLHIRLVLVSLLLLIVAMVSGYTIFKRFP